MDERRLSVWVGNMYKELIAQGIPHPAVQGILASTMAMIYFQPKVEQSVKTEADFKNIVKTIEEGENQC